MSDDALPHLGERCAHLCVDMQRLFAEPGDWYTPALAGIVPAVERLAAHDPARTLFTRFVTPVGAEQASGRWAHYYRRWPGVLLPALGADRLSLVQPLRSLAPPAQVLDKTTYSAFNDGPLAERLKQAQVDTLVVSGVETDVCVLATVLDAVDHGYRVVVAVDAVASSDDEAHRATLSHVLRRFDMQVEIDSVEHIIAAWPSPADP